MRCMRCGSENVTIQAVTETKSKTKHRGCLGWAMWLLLAACTCGLILIIPAITNSRTKTKTRTHSEAVCQCCGHRWRI
ncbi:MAG: hypothetical protein J6C96_08710 [Oscillospiraceae bacterium]|nr:hypothetical protein [Oscillospiraceae bacterium]